MAPGLNFALFWFDGVVSRVAFALSLLSFVHSPAVAERGTLFHEA
jgi:hypothetical protein